MLIIFYLFEITKIRKKILYFSIFFSSSLQVCTKGDNTSAIYRLKVSEKYAFVQTHSRLVANIDHNNNLLSFSNNNNNNTDLGENDKQIICSTHSIIK